MPETTAPDVAIQSLSGNCPVQARDTINGKPFYFRARGEVWSICIGDASGDLILQPDWYYEEYYGDGPFDAGWMSEDEARKFIHQAADKFAGAHIQRQL